MGTYLISFLMIASVLMVKWMQSLFNAYNPCHFLLDDDDQIWKLLWMVSFNSFHNLTI